jgi:hypothetical protein
MCSLVPHALFAAVTADGGLLMTQDARGIHIRELAPRFQGTSTTLEASGEYNLQPSPDGRWLFAIANSPRSSLDIFDLHRKALVRRIPISQGPVSGVWAGGHFYLFSYSHPGKGLLREVRPEDSELERAKTVYLPDFHGACNQPLPLMLAGTKDRILLAEAFGYQVDRRDACPGEAAGGIYAIDPSSRDAAMFTAAVHVRRMAVAPDGQTVFAIDAGPHGSRLLRISSQRGMNRHIELPSGDWNLSLARISQGSITHGFSRAYAACSR